MFEAAAAIPTAQASKYVRQLCSTGLTSWRSSSPTEPGLSFPRRGRDDARGRARELVVTIGADDEATLERMKSVLATHLDRFAFREAPLAFEWRRAE